MHCSGVLLALSKEEDLFITSGLLYMKLSPNDNLIFQLIKWNKICKTTVEIQMSLIEQVKLEQN